jgi:hypothetical protein
MINLNRNARGESMAQVNKKICVEVYQKYQSVFDQINLAIDKEPQQADGRGQRLSCFAVSLSDPVQKGLLAADVTLTADYSDGCHVARLVNTTDGVQVQLGKDSGATNSSLSKAANVSTGKPTNGWPFWKTKAYDGSKFGSILSAMRSLKKTCSY